MPKRDFASQVRPAPDGAESAALEGVAADVHEKVMAAARAKAGAVAAGLDFAAVVLGADTLVETADGRVLGKGGSEAESRDILRALAGTRHRVVTGVVLIAVPGGGRHELAVVSDVEMTPMSEAQIDAYVFSGGATGAAGAYRVQREGTDRYVRVASGSFSNVVGLPMEEIIPALVEMGIGPAVGEDENDNG